MCFWVILILVWLIPQRQLATCARLADYFKLLKCLRATFYDDSNRTDGNTLKNFKKLKTYVEIHNTLVIFDTYTRVNPNMVEIIPVDTPSLITLNRKSQ